MKELLMQITVSARHDVRLVDSLRTRAHAVLGRLGQLGDRVLEGTAIFDSIAGSAWVELRLHLVGGKMLVATAEAPDHRTALDRVEGKARRQVRRANTRPLAHRHAMG
jgi:ribosome-associated translation inhibitor RaiA